MCTGITITGYIPLRDIRPLYNTGKITLKKLSEKVLTIHYDKSDGFYRRQLLLTTRDKADGREDDPFLIDKMKQEKEGIFLWGLEGLHRLMANRFRFTISERAAANLEEAREKGNNILVFLKSEGYFAITPGARCRSRDFYNVYERWCQDNLEKPLRPGPSCTT